MNDFGQRLREERERLGLTQVEFGKRCGVFKSTQFRYEKSERSPDVDYWQACNALGVDVQYVITGVRCAVAEETG